jgi:predicted Zn-dependent protease
MGLFNKFIGTKSQASAAKSADVTQELDSAIALHRAGNLDGAEKIYRQILKHEPDNSGANHLLGLIALQKDDIDTAIQLISKAIEQDPSNALKKPLAITKRQSR